MTVWVRYQDLTVEFGSENTALVFICIIIKLCDTGEVCDDVYFNIDTK